MKKITIIATSLLIASGTAIGVAASDQDRIVVHEKAIAAEATVQEVTTQVQAANATGEKQSRLSEEEVVTIAKEVLDGTVDDIELDREDGRLVYEVELEFTGEDYDFDIDAHTGEIINIDGNLLKTPIAEEMDITIQRAQQLALDHLGTGKIKDIELEKINGRYIYELEVKIAGEDGDVSVDATNGDILYVEDDLREVLAKVAEKGNEEKQPKEQVKEQITVQQAIEIALSHVGGGKVDDADLEKENGRFVYEIEIEQENNKEVDVVVDAHTGEVLYVDWD